MRITAFAAIVAVVSLGAWGAIAQAQSGQGQPAQQQGQAQPGQQQPAQQQPGQQQWGPSVEQHGTAAQPGAGAGSTGGQMRPGQGEVPAAAALITAPNQRQIQGRVLDSREVEVDDVEHKVVRVRTKDGQVVQVDLGDQDRLPDGLDIREQQWVIVTGVPGQLKGEQVLTARNLANVFEFEGAAPRGGTVREELRIEREVEIERE